ncbi:MAG TPA: hypothetical protein VL523_13280 [Terriglobia bacterium]|nr:hypothetical protein [Terriglobia bacterium]
MSLKQTIARIFVIALVSVAAARVHAGDRAPSASKIIAAYLRAAGGSKRLAQLRSVEFEGTVTGAESGTTGSYTLILEQPNHLYQELTLGGETTREAYNGKSAWREDRTGLRTLTGAEGAIFEATSQYRNDRFVHYRKDKERVVWAGDETVRGRAAHKVEVATPANLRRQVYFDASSHLILEETVPHAEGAGEDRVFYGDYRPVDGIPEPSRIDFEQGGRTWTVVVSRVLHNPGVDEAVFDFPAASGRPLPALADLLKAVDANQKALEKLVEQYTCDKTEEEFEVDSHGALKSKGVKEYQVFYLDGDEVDRLVKKDGQDLSPAEQQSQNEHIRKRVEEYEKKQAKRAQQAAHGQEEKRNKDDVRVSDFLRMDRFTHPRREAFRGHEVIVFDFEPNPSYKPASTVERLLHELIGAVWIDERAEDVVRLDAYLAGNFRLAGGLLATLQKGSAFTFEQTRINNEVWLPSSLEAHVSARLLLLKGLSGNVVMRYRNYQKFHVESVTRPGTVPAH